MLTPLFSLSQTSDELILKLHIPLADLGSSEFLVEDGIIYFGAPPYYLRLELPGSVVEDDDHINFKLEFGDLFVTMTKSTSGEHFSDLDLLSKFIINPPSTKAASKTRVQILDSAAPLTEGETFYDWFAELPQTIGCNNDNEESNLEVNLFRYPYGFAASKMGLFEDKPETCLPIHLPNPDFCSPQKRHSLQLQSVQNHFQAEHYVADFYETEVSLNALSHLIPWINDKSEGPDFSDEFRHRLAVLSTHPLPLLPPLPSEIDSIQNVKLEGVRTFVYLTLVDLLLAYTYDYRVREGDENCESGWVIAEIASSLSWLELFPNLPTLLCTFYERALSFPLIRTWKLCRRVHNDVAALLQLENAKGWILYILLDIRRMLIDYPGYYIFVDLFLDDYIVWLQKSASSYVLKHLGEAMASFKIKKSDLNLPLKKVEQIGAEALEDESLVANLDNIALNP